MALDEFISDGDVIEMRMLRNETLVHRATVIEVGEVSAPSGVGFVESESVVKRDVCCLLQPATNERRVAGAQEVSIGNYVCVFKHDETSVQVKRRLYVEGTIDGVAFAKRVGVVALASPGAYVVQRKARCSDSVDEAGSGPPPE